MSRFILYLYKQNIVLPKYGTTTSALPEPDIQIPLYSLIVEKMAALYNHNLHGKNSLYKYIEPADLDSKEMQNKLNI